MIDQLTIEKVDLALRRDTPFGREAFGRRIQVVVGRTELFVTTPEDVILAKLDWAQRSGSERQLQDVAGVLRVQGDHLDMDYIRDWADEMALTDALDQAQRQADDSDS